MWATASATRSGSAGSGRPDGRDVSTRQKRQARVHWSPLTMKVAVPSAQHSKMLGQPASSHTVTRSRLRMVRLTSRKPAPRSALTRSHVRLALVDREPAGGTLAVDRR